MTTFKPTICIDFDGVIHSYISPWAGPSKILDPIVPGAIQFMLMMLAAGYHIAIHSSRSHSHTGFIAMQEWLKKEAGNTWYDSPAGPGLENVEFVQHKPIAMVYIDDRAMLFTGVWPTIEDIKNFVPWNKKEAIAKAEADKMPDTRVTFSYTNYRGEESTRLVRPDKVYFGSTEWHVEPQWLLLAYDLQKEAMRTFALNEIANWSTISWVKREYNHDGPV